MGAEELKAMRDRLARLEKTTGSSGAVPLTPKAKMLDASAVSNKDPEHHYRFISVKQAEAAQARLEEGYVKVPDAEGGRSLGGSLVLMKIPRAKRDERVKRQEELNKQRLSAHKTEMERLAESVSRELRDRHGVNVPAERLLVSE